jgi:hypothetical protein
MDDEIQAERPRPRTDEAGAFRSGLLDSAVDEANPFKLPEVKSDQHEGSFPAAILSVFVQILSAIATARQLQIGLEGCTVFLFIVLPASFCLMLVWVATEFPPLEENRCHCLVFGLICGIAAGTIPLMLVNWMRSQIFQGFGS